jgi:hypothetical protein
MIEAAQRDLEMSREELAKAMSAQLLAEEEKGRLLARLDTLARVPSRPLSPRDCQVCFCASVSVSVSVSVCLCVCVCVCVCVLYVYVCFVHVCVCMYTHTHTHTHVY